MSYNDAKLLQELIELLVNEKVLEKSKLQKFKMNFLKFHVLLS